MAMDNPYALRDAFGAFMTGVTVVTAYSPAGRPLGFTANSFTSVSLDPPLLLVCLARRSSNYAALISAAGFAVNILAEGQRDISNTFAGKVKDRFASVAWQDGPNGSPVLEGVSAWFDCAMHQVVEAGDHAILIGAVKAFENGSASGLGYARGAYFSPAPKVLQANTDIVVSALVEKDDEILFAEDAEGRLSLPARAVKQGVPSNNLEQLLGDLGASASIGFIYSVYEDRQSNTQHLVYRCTAAAENGVQGVFLPPEDGVMARIADKAVQVMLRRFVEESRMGHFGIYLGNQDQGEVRRIY